MANEVQKTLTYKVNYTKPEIEIANYDQLADTVKAFSAKFKDMVVTEESVADAKAVLADYRKLATSLNKRRIEIGKDYNAPLKAFKGKVDDLIAMLDQASGPIDAAVKQLSEAKRARRSEALDDTIQEMLPKYELELSDMDEIPGQWLNEANWKQDDTPRLPLIRLIGDHLQGLRDRKARIAADRTAAKAYAESNNLEPASWLVMLDEDRTFAEVQPLMDKAVAQREHEEKQARARQAYEEAMAKMSQEQHGDKTIDTETGEVIEQMPLPEEPPMPELPTGTIINFLGDEEALKATTDFMRYSGYAFTILD
ncbi:DUF1351 domain-containing protein [Lacticaseibacillus absianus]|uniref:DUF1351 domain-containing protein n=1 Tax=Lacticaseibacillus absianus TaxID=2729623 RepID=UPI0015C7F459|nr:DUF1351 domain-containing protein [Lacticaseibacillus absianus]